VAEASGVEARDQLRAQIERWRRSEAEAALANARGEEPPELAFPSRDAVGLLAEAAPDLEPGEHEASAAHLARAEAERTLEGPREALEGELSRRHGFGRETRSWRALLAGLWQGELGERGHATLLAAEEAAERADRLWRDARRASDRRAQRWLAEAGVGSHADAGPDAEARRASATRWLDATDDVLRGILDERGAHDAVSLLAALRRPELDVFVSSKTRWRRFGEALLPFGYEAVLDRVVRVDAPHRAPFPAPRLVVRTVGRDAKLLPPRLDHGVLGEVLAMEVAGRAVALSLGSPGLPPALARPAVATVARGYGQLFAQLACEPATWRARAIEPRHADTLARHAALVTLVLSRVLAVGTLVRGLHDTSAAGSGLLLVDVAPTLTVDVDERVTELVERALGVPLSTRLARALVWSPASSGARFRALVGAFAAWGALRDRFDEDWYRNPRAEQTLRAAFERGGRLSIEAWCAELGATEEHALARAHELFAR